MRVGLVVCGSLDTSTGGYLYDRQLVEFLRAHGDTVEVLSLPDRGYVRNLATRRVPELACDVVLEDELCHPALAFSRRRQARTPVVAVVHLLRSDEHRTSALRPLYSAVERRYLSGVDATVCNSETTRASAERLVGCAIPGVVARPAADHLAAPSVPRVAVDAGPLRVLCLANVLPNKGVLTLVEALGGLPSGTWQLTVAGRLTTDPAYVGRVRERIDRGRMQGAIDLIGAVPSSEVANLLASHHAVAVPSSYEAAGIAYLEAMRTGRPVIATAAGGAHELLDDGVEGFLVPPGAADGLRRRLVQWAGDRVLLERMGEAARRRADAHPTWTETLRPVRELLMSLVEARTAPVRREAAP
jgi:glycosyltransferase involved in cell wall biosynthesis